MQSLIDFLSSQEATDHLNSIKDEIILDALQISEDDLDKVFIPVEDLKINIYNEDTFSYKDCIFEKDVKYKVTDLLQDNGYFWIGNSLGKEYAYYICKFTFFNAVEHLANIFLFGTDFFAKEDINCSYLISQIDNNYFWNFNSLLQYKKQYLNQALVILNQYSLKCSLSTQARASLFMPKEHIDLINKLTPKLIENLKLSLMKITQIKDIKATNNLNSLIEMY